MDISRLRFVPLAATIALLAGCATPSSVSGLAQAASSSLGSARSAVSSAVSSAAPPASTTVVTKTVTVTATATASSPSSVASTSPVTASGPSTTVATSTSSSSAASAATTSNVSASAAQAIQAVIQKANQEQVTAFAKQNPTVMQDTATTSYYQQLVQINQDLQNSGVSSIKLISLKWGGITAQGATGAQATTFETWRTVYSDGTVDQSTNRNVYTLVQQNGAWKIQTDVQPATNLNQPGSSGSGQPGTIPAPPTLPSPLAVGASHNWSGYAATGGKYTAVSGTWTVPNVATGTPGTDATWVGIGGVNSRDLIQAGTEALSLNAGTVRYQAWIETLPQASHPVPLTVSPGDSITVSLKQQSAAVWVVTFKDNTTGQSYQANEQYNSSLSSAEWVEEAPSGGRRVLPLDNFGTVQFTSGSTVKNGATDTIAKAGAKSITMINRYGQPIAKPSALGANGSSFSVTREANTTTPISPNLSPFPSTPGRSGFGQGVPNPLPQFQSGNSQ